MEIPTEYMRETLTDRLMATAMADLTGILMAPSTVDVRGKRREGPTEYWMETPKATSMASRLDQLTGCRTVTVMASWMESLMENARDDEMAITMVNGMVILKAPSMVPVKDAATVFPTAP